MNLFDINYFDKLTCQAKNNPRLRQNLNLHLSYSESCQRFFNAIEPGSYIRPHRHYSDPRDEMLIAVRGTMALVIFDDNGSVTKVLSIGDYRHNNKILFGTEVSASIWHTIIALEPGCILLEIKAGPFDPNKPKDYATWAPEEGEPSAQKYLSQLNKIVFDYISV